MLAVSLFGHWLDAATNPFVLAAPLVLALWTGRPWAVRVGTTLLAAALGSLPAWGAGVTAGLVALALSALAGLVVAEIWLALILPVALGIARRLRRWLGAER